MQSETGHDSTSTTEPRSPGDAEPGTRIGRFTLSRVLGEGGMGVVYEAYDDRLERRVAIKLLRGSARLDSEASQRMRREAQALARLSHPNVVGVFEVDEYEGRLYLAMEYLEGETLSKWLRSVPRSHDEIIEVLTQAGRGLAAAHEAGLVHRDFKPGNVVVGRDGRTRVLDFGLARSESTGSASTNFDSIHEYSSAIVEEITEAGIVLGTPAYMSPEQFRNLSIGPRSDQFSFCIAAWEALHGRRPFSGDTFRSLGAVVCNGKLDAPPDNTTVPVWLTEVLTRGLSKDPESRYPDMPTLLDAMTRAPNRRSVWVAGVVGMVAVAGVAYGSTRSDPVAPPCADTATQLRAQWNDERSEALHAAFSASPLPHARHGWNRTSAAIDEFSDAWVRARVDACELHRDSTDDAAFDRRVACLESRRSALEAVLEVLEKGDRNTIGNAVRVVGALPSPVECIQDDPSLSLPPPDIAANVAKVRQMLVRARALLNAGHADDAAAELAAALIMGERLEYAPLLVELHLMVGRVRHAEGNADAAVQYFERAYLRAVDIGDDDTALLAAFSLIDVVGKLQSDVDEGMRWFRHAQTIVQREGVEDTRRAWMLSNAGTMLAHAGRFDEGVPMLREAITIARASEPLEAAALSSFINNLGSVELMQGHFEPAQRALVESLELRREHFGRTHPLLVSSLANLGAIEIQLQRTQAGRQYYEQALAVLDANESTDTARRAKVRMGLAMAFSADQDYEGSYRENNAGLKLMREALGPDHPQLGMALARVGDDLRLLGRTEEAIHHLREALRLLEPAFGPGHPHVSAARQSLASMHAKKGEHQAAADAFLAIAKDTEAVLGPEHFHVGTAREGAGQSLLELGQADRAVQQLTRAAAILERESTDRELASVRFGLARALREAGKDPGFATSMAERARDALPPDDAKRSEIEAWLADGT